MDYNDVCTEVMGGTCGVHDPSEALVTSLHRVGVETDEVWGVATESYVQLLCFPSNLLCPFWFDAGPTYELDFECIQTKASGVFQRTFRSLSG